MSPAHQAASLLLPLIIQRHALSPEISRVSPMSQVHHEPQREAQGPRLLYTTELKLRKVV